MAVLRLSWLLLTLRFSKGEEGECRKSEGELDDKLPPTALSEVTASAAVNEEHAEE